MTLSFVYWLYIPCRPGRYGNPGNCSVLAPEHLFRLVDVPDLEIIGFVFYQGELEFYLVVSLQVAVWVET